MASTECCTNVGNRRKKLKIDQRDLKKYEDRKQEMEKEILFYDVSLSLHLICQHPIRMWCPIFHIELNRPLTH